MVGRILAIINNDRPEAGLSQAIAQANSAIDEVGFELCRLTTEKHLALSQLSTQQRRHEQLVAQGNSALIEGCAHQLKATTQQQLELEMQMARLEQSIAELTKEEKEMAAALLALRTKKHKMETMLRHFINARSAPSAR